MLFNSVPEYLLNRGVDCFHDNAKLVTTSHIVFLCVLPSQVPAIADEIKADIPPTLFLYSLASSLPTRKLRQLFGTTNVIHPEYTWDESSQRVAWDYSINVNTALENKNIVAVTCPLRRDQSNFLFTSFTSQFVLFFRCLIHAYW